jgi:hypothetical protein
MTSYYIASSVEIRVDDAQHRIERAQRGIMQSRIYKDDTTQYNPNYFFTTIGKHNSVVEALATKDWKNIIDLKIIKNKKCYSMNPVKGHNFARCKWLYKK